MSNEQARPQWAMKPGEEKDGPEPNTGIKNTKKSEMTGINATTGSVPMVEIHALTKRFGSFTAVDGIDLTIARGSVFGFVGPNGAGKSTTMMVLATLLQPTEGYARVAGFDCVKDAQEVRRRIGYMPDFFGVYDQLKATEYLNFYGRSYGIKQAQLDTLIPRLLALVNLADKADTYVDALSRGMKQRLCLARCLVHDPELLILDEPASGLDPRSRIEMREILKELKALGKTILISSHILPELAEMVDEIGVIERGRLIAAGNVRDIEARMSGGRMLTIRLLDRTSATALEETLVWLESLPYVVNAYRDDGVLSVQFTGDDAQQAELLHRLMERGQQVVTYGEQRMDLEDVFLAITQGEGEKP
jgi:ABC-2 type transport system ATP-binding protein